jgi:uncharacterized membrane protein
MARIAGIAWRGFAVAGILAYEVLVHLAVTNTSAGAADPVRATLLALPLIALGCWILLRSRNRIAWLLVLGAAAGAMLLFAQGTGLGKTALYGVPHAAAYLFLLWLFGRTLARGREPIITRLARHARGTLPPAMQAYTRNLTLAWCVFFAAQFGASALLLRFGTVESWSLFVNVLNFPLVALMFLGDYLYRVIRYRNLPQSSIAKAVRAWARDRASTPLPR